MAPVQVRPFRVGEVELLVETVSVAGTEPTSRVGKAGDRVVDAFEHAREAILQVANETVGVIRAPAERAPRPAAVEVEFGLKFSAQGNVIVAGASGEASLVVRLSYESDRVP